MYENTAELTRCERYGPVVVGSVVDPEDKTAKTVKRYTVLSPGIYDLYQTLARVGDAEGAGYGMGGRTGYGQLRQSQREALIRMYGPEAVGYHRRDGTQVGLWEWAVQYVIGPGVISLDPRFDPAWSV